MKRLWVIWLALQPWKKIIFAVVAGIILGLFLEDKALYLQPIGTLFINAIKMMIVPVVFTAIVCSILSISEPEKMRRIGSKAFILYGVSMTVSAIVGLSVATLISPGRGLSIPLNTDQMQLGHLPAISEAIVNLIRALQQTQRFEATVTISPYDEVIMQGYADPL